MRLILTNLDLSGQTIVGQPFSYIGNCTGTDVHFTGDWRFVSMYNCNFLRPDWSGAQTRFSYSRFNTFTSAIVSPDIDLLYDHEMLLAMFQAKLPSVTGLRRTALLKVINGILADSGPTGTYRVSWANMTPPFVATFASLSTATTAFRAIVGTRQHLIDHFLEMAAADPTKTLWDDSVQTPMPDGGVLCSDWGIVARNAVDGRTYTRKWDALPMLINPHDRVEMGAKLEAEIEVATGQQVRVIPLSLLPWRCRIKGRNEPVL